MLPVLLPVLLQVMPGFVISIEELSHHKAAATGKPMTGAEKLNTVTSLAMTLLQAASIVDPKHVGQSEVALAQEVTNAIVKYSNAKGAFTHVAAPAAATS